MAPPTPTDTKATPLRVRSAAFLDYLDELTATLPDVSLDELLRDAGGARNVAIVAVDVVNGFCVEGPLASARVGAIVRPIRQLIEAAQARGVRRVAVLRDSHDENAPEFEQFGPHCLAGGPESDLVSELAALTQQSSFTDIPKNATSAWAGAAALREWVESCEAEGVTTYIVVGDCTDLCVYQTAMPLKLSANARNRRVEVVVPVNCVDTYDLPVETARSLGATPHDADLLHGVFLYHLALNGVRVVGSIV